MYSLLSRGFGTLPYINEGVRDRQLPKGDSNEHLCRHLSREATEADLKQAFEAFGKVDTAAIIKDKVSGESKGFGFVEMPVLAEAQAAMTELNGKDLKNRAMTVNEAKPRTENRKGGGRSGFGGGNRY